MIEHLNSHNPRQRTAAIHHLSQSPDVPALLNALKHPTALVRAGAAQVLGIAKIEAAVPALITRLHDGDVQVRLAALDALALLNVHQALEPLIACLQDTQHEVVTQAAYALGRLGDRRAVEPLINALQHPNLSVQTMAAFALARLGDTQAVMPLIEAMRRYATTIAVVRQQWDDDRNQMVMLGQIAQHGNTYAEVLEHFAARLGQLGVAAIEPLTALLPDPNPYLRLYIAVTLGHIQDKRSLPALEQLAADVDAEVRRMAAWALAQSML